MKNKSHDSICLSFVTCYIYIYIHILYMYSYTYIYIYIYKPAFIFPEGPGRRGANGVLLAKHYMCVCIYTYIYIYICV